MKFKIHILLLLLCLNSCYNNIQDTSYTKIDKLPNVEVVSPKHRSFTSRLELVGNALPNKKVNIHAMEGGNVYKLYKDIGDKVTKGEALASLNNPELTREWKSVQVSFNIAKQNYFRLKSVKDNTPELTTIQAFEIIEAAYLTAKASYDAIFSRHNLLTIKAPFAGIVTQRNIELGELVQSGLNNVNTKPLFEIMDVEIIRVSIALPETEIDNIHEDVSASIHFPEISGEDFVVEISRMANVVRNQNKTMEVQFDIKNDDNNIKPGMYCSVSIELKSTDNKLSLPIKTLIALKGEYFLLNVVDSLVKKTAIKKGLSNSIFFEVLSSEIDSLSYVIIVHLH